VVRSLEAALWSFYKTDSFEAAIFKAANHGDDADTTAESGIPKKWLERLAIREEITNLAERLFDTNRSHA